MYNYSIFVRTWQSNCVNDSVKEWNACRVGEIHDFLYARLVRDVPESGVFSPHDDWLDCSVEVEGVVDLIF